MTSIDMDRVGPLMWPTSTKAAKLTRRESSTEFAYLPEYLQDGIAVATTLPLSDSPCVTPAGAVPAFFAGLLPEGRRLSNLRRAVKTSADDELALLLAVGRDPIGDVQVVPEGEVPAEAEPLVRVERSFAEVQFGKDRVSYRSLRPQPNGPRELRAGRV